MVKIMGKKIFTICVYLDLCIYLSACNFAIMYLYKEIKFKPTSQESYLYISAVQETYLFNSILVNIMSN